MILKSQFLASRYSACDPSNTAPNPPGMNQFISWDLHDGRLVTFSCSKAFSLGFTCFDSFQSLCRLLEMSFFRFHFQVELFVRWILRVQEKLVGGAVWKKPYNDFVNDHIGGDFHQMKSKNVQHHSTPGTITDCSLPFTQPSLMSSVSASSSSVLTGSSLPGLAAEAR